MTMYFIKPETAVKVLVINCGSSSIKYQLIDTVSGDIPAKGAVERIGFDDAVFNCQAGACKGVKQTLPVKDHTIAIRRVLDALVKDHQAVDDLSEISAVGHRFVHGGKYFKESVIIDESVLATINKVLDVAPLHNPANLLGIEACLDVMPKTPQVAVFDTAFHSTLPPEAYMYAIPYELYEKLAIRRYGFHGTSHYFVSHRAAEMLERTDDDFKVITCHLGNGGSIDAVKGGKAVETTMGFTPLEGLIMGTRSGDIDAAAVLYIMKLKNMTASEMDSMLNKKSGLLGVSGVSSDMREIVDAAKSGNERAQLAIDMYVHRIRKYIGAYIANLGGLDALVFTAGVGEHETNLRARICENLKFFGVEVDPVKNDAAVGGEHEISIDGASVKVLVIPTNEEGVIAKEAERLCK